MNGGGTKVFETQYDWSNTAPSVAVINAIATIENIEPTNFSVAFDTTLFDHIDPEALDALITEGNEISISFSCCDYRIQVNENTLRISLG